MISKRYNKLFNNFEVLKQKDAKHRVSLDNIAQVKKELKDIKKIGKFTSKKSNIFFDDIKLNYNQIDTELNHLRDAILTDQIFDNSEVQILSNKFNDIFDISHSLNLIKNVLDKKNIITDTLYLELDQSITSFSKIFKTELNNILNEKKTIKGINSDLINFKNILDRYTEFNQKKFDEIKNKNGVDISALLLNKKYIANILSTKQVNNVESYTEQLFREINNFNEGFNDLLTQYEKYIKSSAGQINKKIRENLENKTLKNENILKDIEFILNVNQTAYENTQDKKEAEEERLRLEKEAEEERLTQEEKTRLVAIEKAKKNVELEDDEIKKSELIICVKALFFLVVIFSINFLLDFVQITSFYTELFPIICISVLLFVVHIIRKRRIIQKQELDDKAILKYFSNKELGFFLFLVLLIWLLSGLYPLLHEYGFI